MVGWGGALGLLFNQPEAVGGGKGRLLAFKLGGELALEIEPKVMIQPEPPPRSEDDESIQRGALLYAKHCTVCHGINGIGTGVIADLRYMREGSHQLFDQIVLGGIFSGLGMVSFADVLDESDTKDIHNYVLEAANEKWEDDQSSEIWIDFRNGVYDLLGRVVGLFY